MPIKNISIAESKALLDIGAVCSCTKTSKRAGNSNANVVIPDPDGFCAFHNDLTEFLGEPKAGHLCVEKCVDDSFVECGCSSAPTSCEDCEAFFDLHPNATGDPLGLL